MALPSKAELIGQALLQISGGVLTSDVLPRWGEAETYLCMSVNYVQTGNYWLETKQENNDRTINPLLLTVFPNLTPVYSSDRLRSYIDLPQNVITLAKGRAFELNTEGGKRCYPLIQGDDALEEFYGKYKTNISYQLEGPTRVWLFGKLGLVTSFFAKYIVAIHDLADTDEIILPSDGYAKVVQLTVEFLTGERQADKDYAENAKNN